ncbi:transcription initiation factor TFIID subunit 14b-like [Tripterygium wilfordii]|uniref:Transcription initiation factor TFIID subunit 14b-like n=1 Tax=Tripterygium wilfordii TaxID=458696 RepID=A0A7J7DH61_TRIWF|nr:transcription initiation factor TFIID subunit 14b-like [Tripterygium wilfordii]
MQSPSPSHLPKASFVTIGKMTETSRTKLMVVLVCRFHHLKLYPEDESGPMSMKKPVVVESYDEIVFPEPSEGFLARVQNHPAVNMPRLPAEFTLPPPVPVDDATKKKRGGHKNIIPLSQWFMNFSEADELLQLAAARQQVQAHIAKLKRQISLIDGQQQQLKSSSDQ